MNVRHRDLTDRVDGIEFAAAWDLWQGAEPGRARAAGLIRERHGSCRTIGTRLVPDAAMLNRVMGATQEDVTTGALERAIAALRGAGCTCQISVRDGASHATALAEWLRARGFEDGYRWMKFVRPAGGALPAERPPLVRVRACTTSDRERFAAILTVAYDLPPQVAEVAASAVGRPAWRCYLAQTGAGEPVGAGAMFVQGDLAWLGLGATVPSARGMGAQGAILRARLLDANLLGCRMAVTETGERVAGRPDTSYRNILRAGFTEHGLRRHLVAAPPASSPDDDAGPPYPSLDARRRVLSSPRR